MSVIRYGRNFFRVEVVKRTHKCKKCGRVMKPGEKKLVLASMYNYPENYCPRCAKRLSDSLMLRIFGRGIAAGRVEDECFGRGIDRVNADSKTFSMEFQMGGSLDIKIVKGELHYEIKDKENV